jgi:hypothetical protein
MQSNLSIVFVIVYLLDKAESWNIGAGCLSSRARLGQFGRTVFDPGYTQLYSILPFERVYIRWVQ